MTTNFYFGQLEASVGHLLEMNKKARETGLE